MSRHTLAGPVVRPGGAEPEAPLPTPSARRLVPWWSHALLAFAASRVVSTALWFLVIALARRGSRIGLHATLSGAMTAWDGQWYELVARQGYPVRLPSGLGGLVQSNAWAFLPAYPWTADVLALGDPAAWPIAAELLSTACGFGAAVLLAALLRPHVGDRVALRTVWLFALSPVAFILQAAYAESMGLLLTLGALVLLDRRRYLAAIAPAVLLAFTRPGVQAIALTVAAHLVLRWFTARRAGSRIPWGELTRGIALLACSTLAGFAWPWIAAVVTGVPDAYLATELAWRTSWMGPQPFEPGSAWLFSADFWLGRWGPIGFGLLVALFTALLVSRRLRGAGGTVWAWTSAWGLYLLGAFFPQSSLFRLLLPLAPTGAALVPARSTGLLIAMLTGSVALQALWLYFTFGGWQLFWAVP